MQTLRVDQFGRIDLNELNDLIDKDVLAVSIMAVNNEIGTIHNISNIAEITTGCDVIFHCDGAQAPCALDMSSITDHVDLLSLSAHKMYGPTGVGVLYGKRELLEKMPPYQGGGEMIKDVSFQKTTYNDIPYKFEAGTPNIADVVGFKYAMDFVDELGKENIAIHEMEVHDYAMGKMQEIPGFQPVGIAENKVSVLSFLIEGIHPFDIGQMLDARGVAVRTGHHCTQPLMERFGIEGTSRASFAIYNTIEEVDVMIDGLKRIVNFMK